MGREDQPANAARQRLSTTQWTIEYILSELLSERVYAEGLEKIRSCEAKEAREAYLSTRRWQLYFILSFANPVSEEYARQKGIAFAERLGPNAYAAVCWGEGTVGGRLHVHVLAGGIWTGHMPSRHKALWIGQIAKRWKHGQVVKAEGFDPQLGNLTSYLPDHHEMEIVGTPKRYRVRHKRNRAES